MSLSSKSWRRRWAKSGGVHGFEAVFTGRAVFFRALGERRSGNLAVAAFMMKTVAAEKVESTARGQNREAQIRGGGGVGEGADADDVHAGQRVVAERFEAHAAGDFNDG